MKNINIPNLWILKYFAIVICFLTISQMVSAQYNRTYYITERHLSSTPPANDNVVQITDPDDPDADIWTGRLDAVMAHAVEFLETEGNSFTKVGIIFNVPLDNDEDPNSALVIYEEPLPPLNHSKGTIVFDVLGAGEDQDLPKQGIVGSLNEPVETVFLGVTCFGLEFRNLKFLDLELHNKFVISAQDISSLTINKNYFNNINNTIILAHTIWMELEPEQSNSYHIEENIVENAVRFSDIILYNNMVVFKKNTISGVSYNSVAVNFVQWDWDNINPGTSYLCFEENIINSPRCARLYNPQVGWHVTNNEFLYKTAGLQIDGGSPSSQFIINISFINTTDFEDYDLTNSGNTFEMTEINGNTYSIFFLNCFNATTPLKVIGYDLNRVGVLGSSKVQIRNCNITTTGGGIPIQLENSNIGSANGGIISPWILSRYTSGENIIINYKLPGLNSINGPFAVDFYRSNEDGDLLELLYSEHIETLNTSEEYQSTFYNNNIGAFSMTVTSLGQESQGYQNSIGTSEAGRFVPILYVWGQDNVCIGTEFEIHVGGNTSYEYSFDNITWENCTTPTISHIFNTPGEYTICTRVDGITQTFCKTITAHDCSYPDNANSEYCIESFAPLPDSTYIVGGWVKEANGATFHTYSNSSIKVLCYFQTPDEIAGAIPIDEFELFASGDIIDGWQRIEGEIKIPQFTRTIVVRLNNYSGGDVFFDDIRFHPTNATMQTYVYDFATGKLNAVNDENNYATFYEYDEEGALVRVKKETERGIMTIQESRNTTKKP